MRKANAVKVTLADNSSLHIGSDGIPSTVEVLVTDGFGHLLRLVVQKDTHIEIVWVVSRTCILFLPQLKDEGGGKLRKYPVFLS